MADARVSVFFERWGSAADSPLSWLRTPAPIRALLTLLVSGDEVGYDQARAALEVLGDDVLDDGSTALAEAVAACSGLASNVLGLATWAIVAARRDVDEWTAGKPLAPLGSEGFQRALEARAREVRAYSRSDA